VELEGVEPSSKHAAKMLSTRLALIGFSFGLWHKAGLFPTYPLIFIRIARHIQTIFPFAMLHSKRRKEGLSGKQLCA